VDWYRFPRAHVNDDGRPDGERRTIRDAPWSPSGSLQEEKKDEPEEHEHADDEDHREERACVGRTPRAPSGAACGASGAASGAGAGLELGAGGSERTWLARWAPGRGAGLGMTTASTASSVSLGSEGRQPRTSLGSGGGALGRGTFTGRLERRPGGALERGRTTREPGGAESPSRGGAKERRTLSPVSSSGRTDVSLRVWSAEPPGGVWSSRPTGGCSAGGCTDGSLRVASAEIV
jgi:hypothetical protein